MDELSFLQLYLQRFGHLPSPHTTLEEGLISLQAFAGLNPTGEFDEATKQLVSIPRCGCTDVQAVGLQVKWNKKILNCFIEDYLPGLSKQTQQDCHSKACDSWSAVCDLKFNWVTSKSQADIIFSIGRGKGAGFDGRGGVLAWTTINPNRGSVYIYFDMEEIWSGDRSRDVALENTSCHEIGHCALCLDHSSINTALMAPFYKLNVWKPQPRDDIERAVKQYGNPVATPTNPPIGGKTKILIEVDGTIKSAKVISVSNA